MASKQDIPALLASKDGYAELDDHAKQRLLHMVSDVEEVVGVNVDVVEVGGCQFCQTCVSTHGFNQATLHCESLHG